VSKILKIYCKLDWIEQSIREESLVENAIILKGKKIPYGAITFC
jgi:hypothetical protein